MKRVLALVLAASLGALAWVLPAPEPVRYVPPEPSATQPVASAGSFGTCPWAVADDVVDTVFVAQVAAQATVRYSFPVGGDVGSTSEAVVPGPAADVLDLGSLISRGLSPAVVEFDVAPSASGIVETGDGILAVDGCPAASSRIWHLPGGSTLEGRTLQLQLFNPFSEDARVDVLVVSEVGFEPIPELESVTVPGRSWKTIRLEELLPLRESVSTSVQVLQGMVIPAMAYSEGGDLAVWTDRGHAEEWYVPVVNAGGLQPVVTLANDSGIDVAYEVDVYTDDGVMVDSGVVPQRSHVEVVLDETVTGAVGMHVRSEGLLAVAVVASDGERVAATAATPTTSTRWMLPGFGLAGRSKLWVLNTGTTPATVTYQVLDPGGRIGGGDKVVAPAGTLLEVSPLVFGAAALEVRSTVPVAVGWSSENGASAGYAVGIPVD